MLGLTIRENRALEVGDARGLLLCATRTSSGIMVCHSDTRRWFTVCHASRGDRVAEIDELLARFYQPVPTHRVPGPVDDLSPGADGRSTRGSL